MNARELLNKLLAGKGHRIERTMPVILRENVLFSADLDFLIQHEVFRNGGKLHFIQIGANDGVSRADDLIRYVRNHGASGLMVEPQPDVFAILQKNFAAYPGITLLNKAIHSDADAMTLYRLDPQLLEERNDLPHWARTNGVASFDRRHVLEHARRIGLGEEAIVEQRVSCISLSELLALSPKTPDVLKVDTEGYDYEVLSMLDLGRCRPAIIHFENSCMTNEQYETLIKRLITAGYRFLADKMNTTACLCNPAGS